jgi:hypothetical protein
VTPFTVRWPQAPREDKDFLKSECLPELGACGGQALIASGFGDMVEKMIAPPLPGNYVEAVHIAPSGRRSSESAAPLTPGRHKEFGEVRVGLRVRI